MDGVFLKKVIYYFYIPYIIIICVKMAIIYGWNEEDTVTTRYTDGLIRPCGGVFSCFKYVQ